MEFPIEALITLLVLGLIFVGTLILILLALMWLTRPGRPQKIMYTRYPVRHTRPPERSAQPPNGRALWSIIEMQRMGDRARGDFRSDQFGHFVQNMIALSHQSEEESSSASQEDDYCGYDDRESQEEYDLNERINLWDRPEDRDDC